MAIETTTELAQFVEKELGHDTAGASSQRSDIVSQLDLAHKTVLAGGGILNVDNSGRKRRENVVFNFARSATPKVLTLLAKLNTATLTATRGSNAVTFNTAPDSSNSVVNYFLRAVGDTTLYQISAHTAAATSATLDGPYVGDANLSAANCEIYKLQYTIGSSDVLRLTSPLRAYPTSGSQYEIPVVDYEELRREYPLTSIDVGAPECAGIVQESNGTFTIQMSSYPDDMMRVECDYVPLPNTLSTTSVDPIIPRQHRLVLAHLAIYYLSLRNNDNRAREHLNIARERFSELVDMDAQNISSSDPNYGRIVRPAKGTPKVVVQRGYDIA